jgi:hypothetical protein
LPERGRLPQISQTCAMITPENCQAGRVKINYSVPLRTRANRPSLSATVPTKEIVHHGGTESTQFSPSRIVIPSVAEGSAVHRNRNDLLFCHGWPGWFSRRDVETTWASCRHKDPRCELTRDSLQSFSSLPNSVSSVPLW